METGMDSLGLYSPMLGPLRSEKGPVWRSAAHNARDMPGIPGIFCACGLAALRVMGRNAPG